MDPKKLAHVIEEYLLRLHTPSNDINAEYARGWKGATSELVHSIKDPNGYVNKELGLKNE